VNAWTWLLQRISAAVILVVLGLHIWFLHFAHGGEILRFTDVTSRLNSTIFLVLDSALLLFGLYHALYGFYAICVDFGLRAKTRAVLLGLLVIVGLIFFGFGIYGFWSFMVR
jgi:succinate dehydrogenase hydrophobic anchor subunit